jgi:hypothetical protein
MMRPDGTIMHAEVRVSDSVVMMDEPMGEFTPRPGSLYVYVSDTDAVYKRALQAGATSLTEPADQFYGDRNASLQDPVGNQWWIATHQEDVSPEELAKRAEALQHWGCTRLRAAIIGHSTKEQEGRMKDTYTAIIKQSGPWWIGWVAEVPGVNCQEPTRKALLETLKVTLEEALEINRF